MSGQIHFTDDMIFRANVHGLFRMFVYLRIDTEVVSARDTLQKVEAWSKGEICANQVPIIVDEMGQGKEMITSDQVYQIASDDEFANSPLCNRRPEPVCYDKHLLRDTVGGKYVIMRPDRFVFAACNTERELAEAVTCMMEILRG